MTLYEHLFYLSNLQLFFLSLIGTGILSGVSALTMALTRKWFPNPRGTAIVNTMLSGILLPTGMVIAFVAADVWHNDERGRIAVEQEATAISDAIRVTKHLQPADAEPIKQLLKDYVRYTVEEEWALMSKGQFSNNTEQTLENLMVAAVRLEAHADSFGESIAGQELRKYMTRVELARDDRLRVAETRIRLPKWLAVFVLLFVSACVISELHLNFRRPLVISLTLFSLGFGVTLYLMSAYDRPFTGRTIIEPIALKHVIIRANY